MKTSITLSEIKSLRETDIEKYYDLCLTHAHAWSWENQDAYEWACEQEA